MNCRGIAIVGSTNRCRTIMAETFLNHMVGNDRPMNNKTEMVGLTLPIASYGAHHQDAVSPLAIEVMHDIGIPINIEAQKPKTRNATYWYDVQGSGKSAKRFDVMVSITDYKERARDDQHWAPKESTQNELEVGTGDSTSSAAATNYDHLVGSQDEEYCDPLLCAATPTHWSVAHDATDVRREWMTYSPRNPSIMKESSFKKFQDYHYEGEPQFLKMRRDHMREKAHFSESWSIRDPCEKYPMERDVDTKARMVAARNDVAKRCALLLRRMEEYYGETFLHNDDVLGRLA